jgi:hypothetical protein
MPLPWFSILSKIFNTEASFGFLLSGIPGIILLISMSVSV